MKTLSKGLILVGIPLIYGIVFIASLYLGISQANRLVQNEHTVDDAIYAFDAAARYSVTSVRYQAIYVATQNEQWQKRAQSNEKLAKSANARLDALRKSNPPLPIPSSKAGRSESIPFNPGPKFATHVAELARVFLGEHQIVLGDLADITYPLQNEYDARKEDAASATRFLSSILYGGIFAEFVISIALIAHLVVSITNGIRKILKNTTNISKRLELSAPLKEADEIAELDRFLFQVANQINELERVKKNMIEELGKELTAPLNHIETFLLSLKDGQHTIWNRESIDKITSSCTSVQRLIAQITDPLFWNRSESSTPEPSSAHRSESNKESELKNINIPQLKFSVLKQGLLIILLPLLFQLVFAVMLAGMLDDIKKHNQLEEQSRKFLMSVNQSSTNLLEATRFGMVYTYTKVPVYRQMFRDGLAKATAEIDQAKEQVKDQPDQTNDLQLCRQAMEQFPSRLEKEMSRLAVIYGHNPSSSFATMEELMNLFKDQQHPSKALIDRIQALIDDKVHVQAFQLFFDTQDAMERMISREVSTEAALATQRERLLFTLNLTLLAALGLISIMSMLLANFLIKNMIRRLQHVMANTGRLVKREKLQSPGAVTDEIAYLDQFLCQTGDLLVALEQFKRSFIEILSQEIKTKIMSVCTTLELLREGRLGELTADEMERLKVAEQESEDVVRIINGFLDREKTAVR